jgi:hypothetical protein
MKSYVAFKNREVREFWHESTEGYITGYATQELKLEEFSHENIGQLNTYVSWYAKNMRTEGDNPPIGILLCTQKDHALVEYAPVPARKRPHLAQAPAERPPTRIRQRYPLLPEAHHQ